MARRQHGGIAGGSGMGGFTIIENTLTAVDNTDITIDPVGTGVFSVDGPQQIRAANDLRFADSDSSNYVAFKSPATVGSNVTWTLPGADATTANQSLVSNASGTLSWVTTGAQIAEDSSDTDPNYPIFGLATSGTLLNVKTASSRLKYYPDPGRLEAVEGTFSGTVRALRQEVTYTSSHTLALTDQDKVVTMNNGAPATLTIPSNATAAFPIGAVVYIYRTSAADSVTVAAEGGVTLNKTGTIAATEEFYIRKRATNEWNIVDVPKTLSASASGGTPSAAAGYSIFTFTSTGGGTLSVS